MGTTTPQAEKPVVAPGLVVALVRSGPYPPRPSADLLLTSLALSTGADAVVAVLIGFGHDGAGVLP
ncbi:MAG TPA: hypothetical protein VGJ13_17705 [Pseudonocardiaceae bacterium]|jgi:two-component system chemotaxis response regulator CheB